LEGALKMNVPFLDISPTGTVTDEDRQKMKFVFPAIIAPGKHSYVVRFGADNNKPNYYYHTTLCDTRPEDIPPFVKSTNTNRASRAFDKEASVFQPWKEDNKVTYKKIMQNDAE
jgi:hypothetical protein